MKNKIQDIIAHLKEMMQQDLDIEITAGFDGFEDSIVRVVKKLDRMNYSTYFESISEFGAYLQDKKEKSCTLELDEKVVKIGGNMPIFANALGNFGIKVNCVGAMGWPEIHQVFKTMSPNCTLYSVADPGYCTALEFNDGKVMLASNNRINSMSWDGIKSAAGLELLTHFYINSRIIGMFNWSELNCSTSIWEGIIRDILPQHKPDKRQIMLFDLSDCSKRDKSDILHALDLIMQFSGHYYVILSLNENEADCVFKAIYPESGAVDLEAGGAGIFDRMGIDMLAIHPLKFSLGWDKEGQYKTENLYIEDPILSTGGGDNFNAGLILAVLMKLDVESSLLLANAASSFYVNNGRSANTTELIEFLKQWLLKL